MQIASAIDMAEFLKDCFNTYTDAKNIRKEGTIIMRELKGHQTDDLGVFNYIEGEDNIPKDLLPVLWKIATDAENKIAPDSHNEETLENVLVLMAALFSMSSATKQYMEIANNIDGLTLEK